VPRIACLRVPLFPLAARLRAEPELAAEALAVVEGSGPAARIVAATRSARRAGVAPGATLAQGRALVPRLVARGRDAEIERAAREALAEVAERVSPRVEEAAGGLVFLDADGLERRFRSRTPERDLGLALERDAAREGLPARVGIAASKLAAAVAAREARAADPRVVPAGEEAAFLAPLPLARLDPGLELGETLARWGLASIGELARLPPAEVASRLGEEGRRLHAVARGLDPRPLRPRQPPPDFREGMELEWPLVTLEPFLFLARAALDRLCRRLEAAGLGCARLETALRLEPAGHDERAIDLPAPTRDPKTLLQLVRLALEERAPGAAVSGFAFVARPDRPRAAQLTLFGPPALSPDRLATTLARLFALLGAGRVGSPRPVDGHRPERFALVPYAPPAPPERADTVAEPPAGCSRSPRGLLAVRLLRPPRAIGVELDGAGRPGAVAAREAGEAEAKRHRIDGRVRVASGPWRLEEQWWSESKIDREYWDVELEGGGLYRLFRDAATGRWFADGAYD
jgi:protein ImuB